MIVCAGDGRGLPDDFESRYPGVVSIRTPGASVFGLRGEALRRARGEIVLITEDHCEVPPDWCRALLDTLAAYPNAAAAGGAVENGSTDNMIDWASYLVAHAPMMPPIQGGPARRISLQAGMALRRRALPKSIPPRGFMETVYVPRLARNGELLVGNAGIVVRHKESAGSWRTFAVHFHNGRSIAGFRRPDLGPGALALRIASTLILPAYLLLRSTAAVFRKGRHRGLLIASLPLMAPMAMCHAAGELVGYLTGEGRSPQAMS